MPSDQSGENNNVFIKNRPKNIAGGGPPSEQEQIPCPRCDSTNTKFCYYNNYNFSQPRHFCKSCRRYWTHGGTLRDIPVGGGTRKNAKRSRTTNLNHHHNNIHGSVVLGGAGAGVGGCQDYPLNATPVLLPFQTGGGGTASEYLKGNNGNVGGSFTSLLNTQGPTGFLALGGFGLGIGSGFVGDVGFGGVGFGRGVWGCIDGGAHGGVGVSAAAAGNGGGGGLGNTWQYESGEIVGGECFSWPDLAISTPGNALK